MESYNRVGITKRMITHVSSLSRSLALSRWLNASKGSIVDANGAGHPRVGEVLLCLNDSTPMERPTPVVFILLCD
jgi:hypothetical protein